MMFISFEGLLNFEKIIIFLNIIQGNGKTSRKFHRSITRNTYCNEYDNKICFES